jgi:hypothetical protein
MTTVIPETNVDYYAEEATSERTAAPETDPTIAHAGLTELQTSTQPNGTTSITNQEPVTSPPQAGAGDEAGNAAGDRWDTAAPGTDKKGSEDSYEMIPRPADEVDVPNPSGLPADTILTSQSGNSWADEPVYDASASDIKSAMASGEPQVDTSWTPAPEPSQPLSASGWADSSETAAGAGQEDGDGFHQVPGRHRGRGGRGRGDGEFRGRGRGRGGYRGDGEFRGRGRGAFRGQRGDGEFRGRGGRGRGPRGGAEGPIRAS